MSNKENFVAYEYKSLTLKRDAVALYTDCLSNFGWTLIEEQEHGYHPTVESHSPVHVHVSTGNVNAQELVSLKFKRDRRINNKLALDNLERRCEVALESIGKVERKNSAYTMGTSLGMGIVGSVILGFSAYSFISSKPAFGIVLLILGIAGWGIGFFSNRKMGEKQAKQADPIIQGHLDNAYDACEQARMLLA